MHGASTTAILIDIYRILDSDFGGYKYVASIENSPWMASQSESAEENWK